ncbi:MAG: SCO family protein [Burkholderiaceae bacterium]|jgi:protein SCO1/2|nr:SCO family protein [Burkholderiaceae bacterium]
MNKRTALRVLGMTALAWGTVGLTACSRESKTSFQGVDVTGAEYARDIPLRDADGRQRSLKDFAGKVVVVFFGYTQCPDVCPTTLQELVEVKQQLGADGERLQGVFVTLDPERDTPEVLKAYVGNFDASFVGLHGTPEETAAVAKDFKLFYKKVPGKTEGTYTLDHSAGSYVYDTEGRLRVYERYGGGPQVLAADVKALLQEKRS